MNLGIQMLSRDTTLNNPKPVNHVELTAGESLTVFFQLVDRDTGLRYIPAFGATVVAQLPRLVYRSPGAVTGACVPNDYSIERAALMAFPYMPGISCGDCSIWSLPLTSNDTVSMASTNMIVTLQEGSVTSIGVARQGIKVRGSFQP
jgi:hypothetical protein